MKRKVIDELINWKTENSDMPILLTGAKGVGKTYLAYDFAKAFFDHIYYINFERAPAASRLFLSSQPIKTLEKLAQYFNFSMEEPTEANILVLDEISYCPEALELINSLQMKKKFHYIIGISSSPVNEEKAGNLIKLPISPMEFDEFLRATGNEWYIEAITTHFQSNKKIPDIVHNELLALHELYLQIGGMPGIINEYMNLDSLVNIPEQHGFLISSYHDYILKEHSDSDALKMNQVFDSLTLQLMKENKKFQYKLIRKGTTHSMYKDAIQMLCDQNYIIKCNRISNEQLISPDLTFHSDEWNSIDSNTNFKIYFPDTGMLYSKMLEEQGSLFDLSKRKALLENYVAQALRAKNYSFAFWESDSMAKIDFVFYKDQDLIPIEIFAGDNTRSKSISILKQKCNFPYSIKISSKNFEFSNQVKYVPYYAVFCL